MSDALSCGANQVNGAMSRRVGWLCVALACGLGMPHDVAAQSPPADSGRVISFGAFVDAYYAYDAGRPPTFDRGFTTQAARANEFHVNLAFVEARFTDARLRGRLALQAGTSVQANYASEPSVGTVSGASLAQHLQEAYVGVAVTPTLWVDAGIFFSNVGAEGWISADNMLYLRSLVADFSPYYSSGVRAIWQATPRLTARFDVINGWQNISESNTDKSVGTRLDYQLRDGTTLTQYLYVGNEPGALLRRFGGVALDTKLSERARLIAQVDLGSEEGAAGADDDSWHGGTLMARWALGPRTALLARGEWYADPAQVIAATGVTAGLRATGGSVGVDVIPQRGALWRTELRALSARDAVFVDAGAAAGTSRSNLVLVTSLALRF
jgi:hypothetical protein